MRMIPIACSMFFNSFLRHSPRHVPEGNLVCTCIYDISVIFPKFTSRDVIDMLFYRSTWYLGMYVQCYEAEQE